MARPATPSASVLRWSVRTVRDKTLDECPRACTAPMTAVTRGPASSSRSRREFAAASQPSERCCSHASSGDTCAETRSGDARSRPSETSGAAHSAGFARAPRLRALQRQVSPSSSSRGNVVGSEHPARHRVVITRERRRVALARELVPVSGVAPRPGDVRFFSPVAAVDGGRHTIADTRGIPVLFRYVRPSAEFETTVRPGRRGITPRRT